MVFGRLGRRAAAGLLCLLMALSVFAGSAFAQEAPEEPTPPPAIEITKISAATNFTPVALMEVRFISPSLNARGCHIKSLSFFDRDYQPERSVFGTDIYHMELVLEADEGYVFSENLLALLNSAPVDYQRNENGTAVVLRKDYTPQLWKPEVTKHPGKETVSEGGWTSFVASASYASDYKWFFESPDGESVSVSSAGKKFPGLSVKGEGSGKILVYGIPLELDGWSAVCKFTGPGGSVKSKGALISVTPDPDKASPAPEQEAGEDGHVHEFSQDWKFDESGHWHQCSCGEKADFAPHSYVWDQTEKATKRHPGEEKGVCSVCGHSITRETEYKETHRDNSGFKIIRVIVISVFVCVALAIALFIFQLIRDRRGRRR